MPNGNKTDNGVHLMGTDEMLAAYKADTPGELETSYTEDVDKMIKIQGKKNKEGKKNHMSMLFDNPLKGYPYNESVELKELEEEIDALILAEGLSKKMDIKKYAKQVGFDKEEIQWIIDNEEEDHYENNSAIKSSANGTHFLALSYPIRTGDYYFAFIGDRMTDEKITKVNNKMNDAMRKYFQMGQKKLNTFQDDDAEYSKKDMLASYMWNEMSKEFEKLPASLGAEDTMTREELHGAITHMTDDGEIVFEHTTMADDIINEGMFKNLAKGIMGRIRNKLRKVTKKIKLKKKAKDLMVK